MFQEEQNELILLLYNETDREKRMKKIIFIIIAIIIPILELIFSIIQAVDIIEACKIKEEDQEFFSNEVIAQIIVELFTLVSLFCTWGLLSTCYRGKKCILILLILKSICIIGLIVESRLSSNFVSFLIINILAYAIFYFLIIYFSRFKKGII